VPEGAAGRQSLKEPGDACGGQRNGRGDERRGNRGGIHGKIQNRGGRVADLPSARVNFTGAIAYGGLAFPGGLAEVDFAGKGLANNRGEIFRVGAGLWS
jgi:hypothetical protein